MAIAYLGYKVDSSQVALAEKRLDGMSGAAGVAARAAKVLTVAFGAMFAGGAVIRQISDFETSMSGVAAVTRATGRELEAMRDVAKQLGSTTEFTASQAADGLRFLGMAGFEASEAIAAIPAVLDLATASGMGLANAADIASNIMSGFGIEAAKSADVADVLAAASSRANTDVSQLGRAMSTVAPISAALGIGLEDTAAAIGVMSDAGIQGERAGTALRGVLASLAGPTTQAQEALAKYGLTAADVNPETRALADIMASLQSAGLSTADAMTIFGREAASGALVLVDANRRLSEFGDELRGVDGAAADMAATMRDNLGGDIESLRSAVSGLILAMGEAGLTAALRMAAQSITEVVRGISNAIDFVGSFTGYIAAAGTALVAVYAPSIYAAVTATGAWVASLVTLKGALIASGIGAFVVAAGTALNMLLMLKERTGSWGDAIVAMKDLAQEVFGRIGEFGQVLSWRIQSYAAAIKAGFISSLADVADFVLGGWANSVIGSFVGAKDAVIAAWGLLPQAFARIGALAINGLSDMVKGGINGLLGPLNSVLTYAGMDPITVSWGSPVNVPDAPNMGAAISGAFSGAMGTDYIGNMTSGLRDTAQEASSLSEVMGIMADAGADFMNRPIESLSGFSEATSTASEDVVDLQETVDALNQSAAGSGSGSRRGSTGGAAGALRETADAADEASDAFKDRLKSAIESVSDAFGDWVSRGFKDFKQFVGDVKQAFLSLLADLAKAAIANPIKIALGMGGTGGGAAAINTGFMGKIFGGFGEGASLFGSESLAAGFSSLSGGTGILGGLGNTLAATFGEGGSISGLVSAIGGGGGLLTSIGAAIPVIGIAAAAFSFFSTKVKELDSGIMGAVDGLDATIETFRTVEKSRFWGLSKSKSTTTKSTGVFDDVIGGIQNSVAEAARVMGFGADIFDQFSYSFKLSLKGLTEEQRIEKVNAELAKMGDSMAALVPNFADMTSLITAANNAIAQTYAMGSTRFEAEMLAAARRRGEITLDRAGQGLNTSDSLIRLNNVEENTATNNKLMERLVNYIEGWQLNGVPVEAA